MSRLTWLPSALFNAEGVMGFDVGTLALAVRQVVFGAQLTENSREILRIRRDNERRLVALERFERELNIIARPRRK